MLDSWQCRLETNQVCLSPECRDLSPTWHSFTHSSELHSQPRVGWGHDPLQSGCLSAQVRGARLWPVPSFQTFRHRTLPNKTSPFLYSLALVILTSSHFQPLPFLLNTSFPLQAQSSLIISLHLSSRMLIYLPLLFSPLLSSPLLSPFSSPSSVSRFLSHSLSFYLLLSSVHLSLPPSLLSFFLQMFMDCLLMG